MPAPRRKLLTPIERAAIRAKTDGRCHVCGGELEADWWADHVRAHSAGGAHAIENYLPACVRCNRMRWHYSPERIKLILEVGLHLCTEMDKGTQLGRAVKALLERKRRRAVRRRKHFAAVPPVSEVQPDAIPTEQAPLDPALSSHPHNVPVE